MPAIVEKIKEKLHRGDHQNTTGTHTTTGAHTSTGAHTTTGAHHNPLDRNHDGRVDLADARPATTTNVVAPGTATTTTTTTTTAALGGAGLAGAHHNPLDKNYDGRVDARDFAPGAGLGGAHHNPLDRNFDGRVDARDLAPGAGLAGAHHNPLDRNYDGVVDARDLTGAGLSQGAYIQGAQRASLVRAEPTIVEQIQKDVVVHERIHPVEKEEIQPIIYREREQLDVKQVTQMMHETQIQPTIVQQRELAPEVRAAVVERSAPIEENLILPTTTRDATLRSQQVHAPIIEETIKKTVIEEVQPVLERDVIVPTIVQNTQPIYEKIVEAPVVTREIRDMRELGSREIYTAPLAQPMMQPMAQREIIQQPPIMEHVTMSTTTTTTDSFIPAKLVQEGELRNFQPAASQIAPHNTRRV